MKQRERGKAEVEVARGVVPIGPWVGGACIGACVVPVLEATTSNYKGQIKLNKFAIRKWPFTSHAHVVVWLARSAT